MERLIHRIWSGPEMPSEYERFGERWAELNPGATVTLWTEPMIRDVAWENQEVIDDLYRRDAGRRSIALFAQLADVIDYELIYRLGGTYVNCDIEPLRSLEVMESLYGTAGRAWAAREDDRWLVNAAMGAPRSDPFFRAVIEELPRRYFSKPGGPMNQTTGPHLLTAVARDFPHLVTLPPRAWNPVHWRDISPGADASGLTIPEGSIGVHHWGHRRDGRSNLIEKG